MTDRELMQQALDALEEINKLSIGENAICLPAEIDGAMDALRERLAQPKQDYTITQTGVGIGQRAEEAYEAAKQRGWMGVSDHRLMEMPEQEPFGHVTVRRLSQRFENHADQYWFFPAGQSPYLDNVDEIHAVYTSPPQRKPLTDEEIWDEVKAADLDWQTGWSLDEDASNRYITFARAIEAAHGIKGEA